MEQNLNLFRTVNNRSVNLISEITEEVRRNPDVKIYIGTDAQEKSDDYCYVSAVVFRHGKRGAHVIYRTEKHKKTNNYQKLSREGEMTIKLADFIREKLPLVKIEALEFDFNNDFETESTNHVATFKGWAEGLNYRAKVKCVGGECLLSIRAADNIVKRG